MPLFSTDFTLLAGAFAMTFTAHVCLPDYLAINEHQENNIRDTRLGFFTSYLALLVILYMFNFSTFNCWE